MDETPRRSGVWHWVLPGTCLILIYGVLRALVSVQDMLLIGFLAILIATVFSFPTDLLSRWISRGWAVVITLVLLVGGLIGLGFITVPIVSNQVSQLISQGPRAAYQIDQWLSHAGRQATLSPGSQGGDIAQSARQEFHGQVAKLLPQTFPMAAHLLETISGVILLIVLGAFLVHQPDSYREGIRSLLPRRHEASLDAVWGRLGLGLRHWVGGILISMTIMGSLTALGLWLAGIQGWFTLGLLTFLGTFVPYAGAIISAIPGLMVGLSQSTTHFVSAAGVYLGIHIIEGYMVQPLVMKRAVHLRPGLLLFWQLLMTGLFGTLGIIAATPLLVCLKVLVGYFHIEKGLHKPGPEP